MSRLEKSCCPPPEALRLSLCCERHQRVVSERLVPGYKTEEGGKGGVSITAAIEAVDKLVEIGLQMPAAQAMMDAQGPDFEVGEDALHSGGGIVRAARAAGLGGSVRREVRDEEGTQAHRGVVGHGAQADAAEPEILNLDGADNHKLAKVTAPAAGGAVVLAPTADFGLVDLDQAGQEVPAGRGHGAAELRAKQPSCLVGAEGKLALQLQRRNAVGLRRHHIGSPEPGGERQLRVVHDGSGGDRGLPAAMGALIDPGLAF